MNNTYTIILKEVVNGDEICIWIRAGDVLPPGYGQDALDTRGKLVFRIPSIGDCTINVKEAEILSKKLLDLVNLANV